MSIERQIQSAIVRVDLFITRYGLILLAGLAACLAAVILWALRIEAGSRGGRPDRRKRDDGRRR